MRFDGKAVSVSKVIESGHCQLPLAFGFPDITTEDLQLLKRDYWNASLSLDPGQAQMQMFWHSYVLEAAGKRFLIDACCGNNKRRGHEFFDQLETPFLQNLEAAGFRPEDIDYVLCTHLHHDHVGWNTKLANGKWVPTFPNAKYVFTKADFDYFASYSGDDPFQNPAFQDSILPIVEAGMAELVDTDHLIEHGFGCGVKLQGAPGHTPGSCLIHAGKDGLGEAIFTGDLFHHPVELINPSSRFATDEDPDLGTSTRRKFLDAIAGTEAIVFPAHFFAGKVLSEGDRFRFKPLNGTGGEIDYHRFI